MASSEPQALAVIEQFLATFSKDSTRNQRRTYMREYVAYLSDSRECPEHALTVGDLLDRSGVEEWLAAASRGATRRRRGAQGPHSRAAPHSMAARVSTLNTFSRFCGSPLRLPRPRTVPLAQPLTSLEAHRVLRLLAAHRPAGMTVGVWERTVAVVALAVCTRRGLGDLHGMRLADVELDRPLPRVRVAGEWYPLDALSAALLGRWLARHHRLTAFRRERRNGDALWVSTRPAKRRPRPGTVAPPWQPARTRTLAEAHRKLVLCVLGSALRLEQFCGTDRPLLRAAVPGRADRHPLRTAPAGRGAALGARPYVGPGRVPGPTDRGGYRTAAS